MAKIRLDKFVCSALVVTRSEAHKIIRCGKIEIDGKVQKDISFKVDEEKNKVLYNSKPISFVKYRYYLLNKPAGYITSTEDERDPTIMEILPETIRKMKLFPVGRLDKDTEGLVLLTDNGHLSHFLLSPKHHVDKKYFLKSDLPLTEDDAEKFLHGVDIGEEKLTLPARLEIDGCDPTRAHITICEGKFHQIKRMLNAVGKNVVYLERVSFANLTLDENLKRGEVRELDESEIEFLENLAPVKE